MSRPKQTDNMTTTGKKKKSNIILRTLRLMKYRLQHDLKHSLYVIIFGTDTFLGKTFDIFLMVAILLSISITIFDSMFNSIPWLQTTLYVLEGFFTFFFTLEYIARVYCSPEPKKYIFSFFGIIDLLATLPPYLSFFVVNARYMMTIRMFRLIRVFRVFKLFNFMSEGNMLLRSLQMSMKKILVFFLFVVILIVTLGTVMYMFESNVPDSKFSSIPQSIYWAAMTMTTVGYGDITPVTDAGRFFATVVMVLGYTIIAVPTGIVSAEMIKENRKASGKEIICPQCKQKGHDGDANYCKYCGHELYN